MKSLTLVLSFWLFLLASVSAQFATPSPGCSNTDTSKMNGLYTGMMQCLNINLFQGLGFLRSMSGKDMRNMNDCNEDPLVNLNQCVDFAQFLGNEALANPSSIPANVVRQFYQDPVGVTSCIGRLSHSSNANNVSPSCADLKNLVNALKASESASQYLSQIQPFRYPPVMDGCGYQDLLHVEMMGLEYFECLGVDASSLAGATVTDTNAAGTRTTISDATVKAGISCLYNPTAENPNCVFISNLINTKLDKVPNTNVVSTATFSNVDLLCQCSSGLGQSYHAQSISPSCKSKQLVDLVLAGENACKHADILSSTPQSKRISAGCTDVDMIRLDMVATQLLDCSQVESYQILNSSKYLTSPRIQEMVSCLNDPTNTLACKSSIDSVVAVARQDPDTVEAHLVRQLQGGSTNPNFCRCLNNVASSAPALDINPQCHAAYDLVEFFAGTTSTTCPSLATTPLGQWGTLISNAAYQSKTGEPNLNNNNQASAIVEGSGIITEMAGLPQYGDIYRGQAQQVTNTYRQVQGSQAQDYAQQYIQQQVGTGGIQNYAGQTVGKPRTRGGAATAAAALAAQQLQQQEKMAVSTSDSDRSSKKAKDYAKRAKDAYENRK
jgi:hypothetical protein